ncbi:hypothetical protein [Pseudomonas syringae]|nr:hypothetical protein [Pseudomonas syringae]
MSGIKNWTVISERITGKAGGTADYASYLVSLKHKNHKNTTILPMLNSTIDNFLKRTIYNTVTFDSQNEKGGRKVESYSQSFNFVLPPPNKPTEEQWKKICIDMVKQAHSTLEIEDEPSEFLKYLFVNVHDQTNPHLNMIIPRIYKAERLRNLDQKKIIIDLKKEFNRSVLKHCEIDFREHKPQKQRLGKRRRGWQMDQDKALTSTAHVAQTVAEAQEAIAKAKLATVKALLDKAEAERATTIVEAEIKNLNKFQQLIVGFTDSLMNWLNSVRNNEYLNSLANKSMLMDRANSIIENPLCSDETYININNAVATGVETLRSDGLAVDKLELSKNIRGGLKNNRSPFS